MLESYAKEIRERIAAMSADADLRDLSTAFMKATVGDKYSYNFSSLGIPIIQYPQDMAAIQELIWQVKPDLIIETGIAHGGSIILSASQLALLDLCEAIEAKTPIDPAVSRRRVVGIDIDIRPHNRAAIEAHPMASRIEMLQGSSIAGDIVARVREIAAGHDRVMVFLDSHHSCDHVRAELDAYASLVSRGSYCVVFDTIIENLPQEPRPWGPGNSPMTALRDFLKTHPEFAIDRDIQDKLLITVAPDGYLKRVA